jgi:hypothetical protein
VSIHNLGKRHVFTDLLSLTGDAITDARVGHDHDVAAVNFRNPVTLITEVFNRNVAAVALTDRWAGVASCSVAESAAWVASASAVSAEPTGCRDHRSIPTI